MALTPKQIDRLHSQLLTSGLQQRNSALYQVIDQLIQGLRGLQIAVFGTNTAGIGGGGGLTDATFITKDDETATYPNSLRLVAGTNITLTVSGSTITIDGTGTATTVIVPADTQSLSIRTADIEINNQSNGSLIVEDDFTDAQVGAPVIISQVPNQDSDWGFTQFIGEILDNSKMRVFWQAPAGAPRQMTINYLIGA